MFLLMVNGGPVQESWVVCLGYKAREVGPAFLHRHPLPQISIPRFHRAKAPPRFHHAIGPTSPGPHFLDSPKSCVLTSLQLSVLGFVLVFPGGREIKAVTRWPMPHFLSDAALFSVWLLRKEAEISATVANDRPRD